MLSIAISSFFALTLIGSAAVIAAMFLQYRDRIVSVMENELRAEPCEAAFPSSPYRPRTVKTPKLMTQHRSLQRDLLRVAA